jgi:hypothetical protein
LPTLTFYADAVSEHPFRHQAQRRALDGGHRDAVLPVLSALLAAAFVKKPGWTYLGMAAVAALYLPDLR